MSRYGIMIMCATPQDVARLIGAAESLGLQAGGNYPATGGSAAPLPPASPTVAPAMPPSGLPPAPPTPPVVPPPAPPAAAPPPAPAPAPNAGNAVSPSDQQQMVEAMGAYIKQHGPEMAMKAFAVYQCPQNVGALTPQQFSTMLQVFRSMQPMP